MGKFLIFQAALLLLGLVACDELVFQPDELRLQKQYLAVHVGITEKQLRSELGEPVGRITYDRSKHRYVYSELEGGKRVVDLDTGRFAASTNIPAADCFDEKSNLENVLVYNEATVFGYFYFSSDGHFVDKKVKIS
jgi:hypothetical protein